MFLRVASQWETRHGFCDAVSGGRDWERCISVERCRDHHVARLRAERGSADLPDRQYWLLGWLSMNGPPTLGALAEMLHVQPPSMTRTVDTLVEQCLVRSSEHPTDGRKVVVSLTDAGVRVVRSDAQINRSTT